jgi:exopolysaccharide biosynthesis protein
MIRNRRGAANRRPRPMWFIVIMHILALGVALNAFALADGAFKPQVTARRLPTASPKPAAAITPAVTATAPPSPAAAGSSAPAETTTPQATVAEDPDQGMWGAKFPDKFTGGDIKKTDMTYQSHDVNISIGKHEKDGVVYFVADIYVRNLENFKATFADEKNFGKIEKIEEQASKRNAILAVNGDNASGKQSRLGYVVRNGYEYRDVPDQDVLVMYSDGSMKTFSKSAFDYKQESETGTLLHVWSFGPMLLDGAGNAMTKFAPGSVTGQRNPRTAVGYYEPGHYCFVVVDGRQPGYSDPGMSLESLSKLMKSLGCAAAYNLDGGQTSMMVYDGKFMNHPYDGGRRCCDILYVCESN